MARFFLDRPVFAWVIAIAMMLAGVLAIINLPVSQYPPIAPPSISITAFYPGAAAETVEDSVVQIIEQKMTGLDQMIYMASSGDSSGTASRPPCPRCRKSCSGRACGSASRHATS